MEISIYTDGGSRGNPGHSGFGVVVLDESKQVIYQKGVYIGVRTNNEAEYAGLIHGLTWICQNQTTYPIKKITFYLDSELVVNQLNGKYRVKAPHLKPIYQQAIELLTSIKVPLTITHVLRERNSIADQLANIAMDTRL